MQDIFISIKAYLYERAASPLTGAFAVSWVVWNYRFFVVLFSDGLSTPSSKFAAIDQLFDVDKLPFGEHLWPCIGPFVHGLLMPAASDCPFSPISLSGNRSTGGSILPSKTKTTDAN